MSEIVPLHAEKKPGAFLDAPQDGVGRAAPAAGLDAPARTREATQRERPRLLHLIT